MGYRLVKGTFQLYYQGNRHVGARPDGDSVWFKPDKPALLKNLGSRSAKFNGGGFAQLRFEGIDALELHYPGHDYQNKSAAVASRDFLLKKMGFSHVDYAPNPDIPRTVRSSTPSSKRGYILSRTIDPFRRPVSFVYTGGAPENDGTNVFLNVSRLNRSLNAKIIANGHAYPAYYGQRPNAPSSERGGLPVDLRARLTELATAAWYADKGVWAVDDSHNNPLVRTKQKLMQLAIWPKLYRRLALYFRDRGNNVGLGGFINWLIDPGEDRDDHLWIISRSENANIHDIIEISNDHINMLYWPEDIVIIPR
jgi:endonuclease YncB( thermonuclease family)